MGRGTRHWAYCGGKGDLESKEVQFLPWMPPSNDQHCRSCCTVTRGVRRWSKKSWWWGAWGKKALTAIQQTRLSWSWNKQIRSRRHNLCGLLPLLGKTWKKKKITPQSSSKQFTPRVHRQTAPPTSRSKLERARCNTPVLPFQTGCVLTRGAPGGEASCDLQTCAQPSTAPACADNRKHCLLSS